MTRDEMMLLLKERQKNTAFEALGVEVDSYDTESVTVSIQVDHRHMQHAGVVHGGIYVLLAESAASIAAAMSVDITQYNVFGMEINANHLRPVVSGKVSACAKPIHRGKTTMVYGIELKNDEGDMVSVSRCTLAIRKR
jgi:1,4-dihydroxy-2-naphthoyl-CoA hydrolase